MTNKIEKGLANKLENKTKTVHKKKGTKMNKKQSPKQKQKQTQKQNQKKKQNKKQSPKQKQTTKQKQSPKHKQKEKKKQKQPQEKEIEIEVEKNKDNDPKLKITTSSDSSSEGELFEPLSDDSTESEEYSQSSSDREAFYDHFLSDSSEDEDLRYTQPSTIGNVPKEWYNEYEHEGYDLEGEKIGKKVIKKRDELDEFMSKMEDPNYWRTVRDSLTNEEHILTDQELQIAFDIQSGKVANPDFDPFAPYIEWFDHPEGKIHPLTNAPEPKRRFVPSKYEAKEVIRIVKAIRNKSYVPTWRKKKIEEKKQKKEESQKHYLLWKDTEIDNDFKSNYTRTEQKLLKSRIIAPRPYLPGNHESYNPPPEYLPSKGERKRFENTQEIDRRTTFLPEKYDNLLDLPSYDNFVKERFSRCLDLLFCTRVRRRRKLINPQDLIPKLPKPQDLRPFPTSEMLQFIGHTGRVRAIDVDPTGQWLASGSDDNTVRIWEIATGKCFKIWNFKETVYDVKWNPRASLSILAVASGDLLFIVDNGELIGTQSQIENNNEYLKHLNVLREKEHFDEIEEKRNEKQKQLKKIFKRRKVDTNWRKPTKLEQATLSGKERNNYGRIAVIIHAKNEIKKINWHSKGEYIVTIIPKGGKNAVFIHKISAIRTQNPFGKSKGLVVTAEWHPTKPIIFIATQSHIRIYHLIEQKMISKLKPRVRWISSLAIHSGGENLVIGSFDKNLCWFDLELSDKPYRDLKYHSMAIRNVTFHKLYPLFASCSDDKTIQIFHGKVYDDFTKNPLIVPLKILKGHKWESKDVRLGVLDCVFHPIQPWLFTSGADKTIRLYC
ncbi:ribosome biogenesis protein bop1 block of proliferation 1 protein [Anaeramoeba flamelloides]|uniref:Ribosome biogenesis protein BOP1 homolog n=1 Tax=Anaeramoeba flamelloides TaxID=1746091 RepID=A0ABQ8YLB7_9EUKA|nr:ribosome biogenesis protein bop1 block of proliferation 1 protein [Anaeramoeba flamelloides]